MEMRVARIERPGRVDAGPAAAGGLFGQEGPAGVVRVPAVKFVRGDRLARAAKKIVPLRGQRQVAEARELPGVKTAAGDRAGHRMIADGVQQVHEPAALGDAGHAFLHGGADAFAHGGVFAQLRGGKLRIAAAEVQPVQPLRQHRVLQRAEGHELCAERR